MIGGGGVRAVMATVGFIGSGMIGGTVARLAVAAGHAVVLSNSRGPDTLKELTVELGPMARAGTAEEAADAGEPTFTTGIWPRSPGRPTRLTAATCPSRATTRRLRRR